MKKQSSNHIFMIEPEVFYSNEETIDSNHYQYENDSAENLNLIIQKNMRQYGFYHMCHIILHNSHIF